MQTQNTYPLLKYSLEFIFNVTKYSEILEQEKKKAIAIKLLQSGLNINSYLFEANTALRIDDVKYKLEKAKISIDEVLYWLKQCVKSNYFPEDINVLRMGEELSEKISKTLNV